MSKAKAIRLLNQRIQQLAVVAESVRQEIIEASNASNLARSATRLFRSIARQRSVDFTTEKKADVLAQSVVCFATAAKLLERTVADGRAVLQWLERSNPSLKVLFKELQSVAKCSIHSTTLAEAVTRATDDEAHDAMQVLHPGESLLGHFYEFFLHQYQRCRRKKSGVYYTPQAVVSYIVRRADVTLLQRFELPLGLAESDAKILDPAMGTGLFLVEAIRHIHATVTHQWQKEKLSPKRIATRWKQYVVKNLLPRLSGYELMLAPFVTAHLNLAAALAATGFDFQQEVPMRLVWKDTLAGEEDPELATVIIGNPPFSGI